MPDLIAIKRLTKSDITFFARHYRAQVKAGDSTAQKSINLNSDVFIDQLFPRLRSLNGQYRFDMLVYGPGNAPRLSTSVMVKRVRKTGG